MYRALKTLVEDPSLRTELSEELRRRWAEEEKEALRKPLLEALDREIRTLKARLGDYQEALERLEEAEALRRRADLLLARLKEVPKGAEKVVLEGFDGKPVEIPLDPALSPRRTPGSSTTGRGAWRSSRKRPWTSSPRPRPGSESWRRRRKGLGPWTWRASSPSRKGPRGRRALRSASATPPLPGFWSWWAGTPRRTTSSPGPPTPRTSGSTPKGCREAT